MLEVPVAIYQQNLLWIIYIGLRKALLQWVPI
jgi:hypothetical protein